MSVEKLVEQDFQALETCASKGEAFSEVALTRIVDHIQTLQDADRIYHWFTELRRIGALPPEKAVRGDLPPENPPPKDPEREAQSVTTDDVDTVSASDLGLQATAPTIVEGAPRRGRKQ